jgi:hypothetical protein
MMAAIAVASGRCVLTKASSDDGAAPDTHDVIAAQPPVGV